MNRKSSCFAWLAVSAIAVPTTAALAGSGQAVVQRADFAGTWDLTWQTEKGPVRKGHMEIVQSGSELALTIYGNSTIKARGTADGNGYTVRGSRFLISYSVAGKVTGNSMTGLLKFMSSERPFTAERRAR